MPAFAPAARPLVPVDPGVGAELVDDPAATVVVDPVGIPEVVISALHEK